MSLDEERISKELLPYYADQAEHLDGVIARYPAVELRFVADFLADLAGPAPEEPSA